MKKNLKDVINDAFALGRIRTHVFGILVLSVNHHPTRTIQKMNVAG